MVRLGFEILNLRLSLIFCKAALYFEKHISFILTGVIFYGTPHKGSPLANLGNNFFYIVFPTIEVQELSYNNLEYLDGLNKHFEKLVGKGLQSLSFGELKVGCGLWCLA